VVASLWKVDDLTTMLLITRFYENILGRYEESRGWALREAKIWLKNLTSEEIDRVIAGLPKDVTRREIGKIPIGDRTRRSRLKPFDAPFYWAAFVLLGNPD